MFHHEHAPLNSSWGDEACVHLIFSYIERNNDGGADDQCEGVALLLGDSTVGVHFSVRVS